MRLICPNCAVAYRIPDRAVPPDGREVQCSACTHAWYQLPPPGSGSPNPPTGSDEAPSFAGEARCDAETDDQKIGATEAPAFAGAARRDTETGDPKAGTVEAPASAGAARRGAETEDGTEDGQAESDDDSDPAASLTDLPRRKIDPDVLAVLRSEAERETRARRREKDPDADRHRDPEPSFPPAPGLREPQGIRDRLARLKTAETAALTEPWQPGEQEPAGPDVFPVTPPPPVMPSQPDTQPLPRTALSREARKETQPARQTVSGLPVALGRRDLMIIEERQKRAAFRFGFGLTSGACAGVLAMFLAVTFATDRWTELPPVIGKLAAGGETVQQHVAQTLRASIEALTGDGSDGG